jgi:hypothetical protein
MTTSPTNTAGDLVTDNLRQRCAEILDWHRTGLLDQNGALVAMAARDEFSHYGDNSARKAEDATVDEALSAIAASSAHATGAAMREAIHEARGSFWVGRDHERGNHSLVDSAWVKLVACDDALSAALSPPAPEGEAAQGVEPSDAYYAAIHVCLDRYRPMAVAAKRRDLWEFIDECYAAIADRAPLHKLNRWLGYIQGVLIEIGCTNVMAERDWSRPHFRPLDFPSAPPSVKQEEAGRG